MKKVRRRAVDPTLRWVAAGPDYQYRVAVRDEDTGDRRLIYEGFRRDCRLPADMRLTPNQLSFRVECRSGDGEDSRWKRCQEYTAIPRTGDELEPHGADVMARQPVVGASGYRLQVRDMVSHDLIVDMVGPVPRFLLPAGQLADRTTEWNILTGVGGVWRKQRWAPVTAEAISAAVTRSQTLIILSHESRRRPALEAKPRPAPVRPLLPARAPYPDSLAIVVPVTAMPDLAPDPSAVSVTSTQWSDGNGGGAAERAATMLESYGLTGWFFLDIEMALGLGAKDIHILAERLVAAGHKIGLYVGTAPLAPKMAMPDRLARMLETLDTIPGASRGVVMLDGEGSRARAEWVDTLAAAGCSAIVLTREAQTALTGWRRWRTTPFLTTPSTVILPTAMILSTPAHARDRAVRHTLSNRDALASGSLSEALRIGDRDAATPTLTVVQVDPLALLDRRRTVNRVMTEVWNTTVKQTLPAWLKAGWVRSVKGFYIAQGESEIRLELLEGLLRGLADSDRAWASWDDVADPARVSGWLPANPAFEPVLEQRRGPRSFRSSALRRYDNAYRLALRAAS